MDYQPFLGIFRYLLNVTKNAIFVDVHLGGPHQKRCVRRTKQNFRCAKSRVVFTVEEILQSLRAPICGAIYLYLYLFIDAIYLFVWWCTHYFTKRFTNHNRLVVTTSCLFIRVSRAVFVCLVNKKQCEKCSMQLFQSVNWSPFLSTYWIGIIELIKRL